MSTAKALLAVLATTLVVTAALLSATATAGATTSVSLEAKAAVMTVRCSSAQVRIEQLTKCHLGKHRAAVLRKMVIRADRDVLQLTRAVRDLNRTVLKSEDLPASTYDDVLVLNARVSRLDSSALRISERTLSNYPTRLTTRIDNAAKKVRALDKAVRDQERDTWVVEPDPTPADPVEPAPEPTPSDDPAPTPTPTVEPSAPAVATFNVKDFGARGDGVADDANAVQAAVDACYAAGGGVVYMPAGTYRFYGARTLNSDLYANVAVKSGVRVVGDGPGRTIVNGNRSYAHPFACSQQANVGVSALEIRSSASSVDGLKMYASSRVVAEDIVVHDCYIGIAFYGCTDSVIRDCTAYRTNIGITMSEPALNLGSTARGLIERCSARDNYINFRVSGIPADGRRCSGVTLTDCSASGGTAFGSYWLAYASNLVLTRCSAVDQEWEEIVVAGVAGASLSDCSPAYVVTAQNNATLYSTYGASTNIVQR